MAADTWKTQRKMKKDGNSSSTKKGVLRNVAKFTGRHLCQSLFFNKFAGLRPATDKNTFFTERLWWMLLKRY